MLSYDYTKDLLNLQGVDVIKIKVLKRNAYGYRNFNRFRNRILHMFNYKKLKNTKAAA